MSLQYSPKNNPRVIIIQKLYGKFFNKDEELTFPKHRYKKFIKDVVKSYKYLDEAIEFANESGLAITDAEIIRTNSTGLTFYNPKLASEHLKSMKNKRIKTKAEKIAERVLYEQQNESVN